MKSLTLYTIVVLLVAASLGACTTVDQRAESRPAESRFSPGDVDVDSSILTIAISELRLRNALGTEALVSRLLKRDPENKCGKKLLSAARRFMSEDCLEAEKERLVDELDEWAVRTWRHRKMNGVYFGLTRDASRQVGLDLNRIQIARNHIPEDAGTATRRALNSISTIPPTEKGMTAAEFLVWFSGQTGANVRIRSDGMGMDSQIVAPCRFRYPLPVGDAVDLLERLMRHEWKLRQVESGFELGIPGESAEYHNAVFDVRDLLSPLYVPTIKAHGLHKHADVQNGGVVSRRLPVPSEELESLIRETIPGLWETTGIQLIDFNGRLLARHSSLDVLHSIAQFLELLRTSNMNEPYLVLPDRDTTDANDSLRFLSLTLSEEVQIGDIEDVVGLLERVGKTNVLIGLDVREKDEAATRWEVPITMRKGSSIRDFRKVLANNGIFWEWYRGCVLLNASDVDASRMIVAIHDVSGISTSRRGFVICEDIVEEPNVGFKVPVRTSRPARSASCTAPVFRVFTISRRHAVPSPRIAASVRPCGRVDVTSRVE